MKAGCAGGRNSVVMLGGQVIGRLREKDEVPSAASVHISLKEGHGRCDESTSAGKGSSVA